MPIISPSILACDFMHLEDEIKRLESTDCEWIHLDVMDGNFVPNLTFGYDLISKIRPLTNKVLDVHLMITNPLEYIEQYVQAGGDYITFHIEVDEDIQATIDLIKANGKKVGIAIKPTTPLKMLLPYLNQIDLILVMSVEPGFGGQNFIESSYDIIRQLEVMRDYHNYSYLISVDGGVNNKTKSLCDNADVLVSGSYLFKGDLQAQIDTLR